jgi:hypothetical protein
MEKTIDKVKKFFEKEYKETERLLSNPPSWCNPKEAVWYAVQRCLGVAQFVQYLDVKYEDLSCYDEIREKFEKLLLDFYEKK